MSYKTIGQTRALIPEAGTASKSKWTQDGKSGDTRFPYGQFKAIATVGEVDASSGDVLTGYPDGQAAWLKNDKTIRVAYQSESYGKVNGYETPDVETYPQEMASGATFTGSKIHYIDYNRSKFADFLDNKKPGSSMVKGSGLLFDTITNQFGEVVTGKNADSEDLGAKWGNQTTPDGELIEFVEGRQNTSADWTIQSFCGAWYEPTHKWGDGIGFENDVWLTAEEWSVGEENAFADDLDESEAIAASTMGLASVAVDIANGIAYTAPALGQTGYEKLLPLNPGTKNHVAMVVSGYNHNEEPAPLKMYVGRKHRDADGNKVDYSTLSDRDAFLARNGLLYGQLYGLALDQDNFDRLGITADPATNMQDAYLTNASAPNKFKGRFYPTSFRWDGFDSPEAVRDTEMMLWGDASEQPDGYTYFNGDAKAEHPAVDPEGGMRYFQNMTQEGGVMGFDLGKLGRQIKKNDLDQNGLPDFINVKARRTLAAVDGSLVLETNGRGRAHSGELNDDGSKTAAMHVEKDVHKTVSPDGLYWAKGSDGDVLILDEDSGNDYGERKFVLPLNSETLALRDKATGYFLAQAGGANSPRAAAEASALGGAFSKATSAEFSGSWDVTAMVTRKDDGNFYSKDELVGPRVQEIQSAIPMADHTFIGVVQMRGESGGAVEELGADAGGQVFQFNFDVLG